jgi:hypothetical protein
MKTTFIDTNELPRVETPEGQVAEILNGKLAGAKNVVGALRWLDSSETFHAAPSGKHQLIYLMEGSGTITLESKGYPVAKGAGVYLGPSEGAAIQAAEGASLKLFHLMVEPIPQ